MLKSFLILIKYRTAMCVYKTVTRPYWKKRLHGRTGKNRDTAVQEKTLTRPYREKN